MSMGNIIYLPNNILYGLCNVLNVDTVARYPYIIDWRYLSHSFCFVQYALKHFKIVLLNCSHVALHCGLYPEVVLLRILNNLLNLDTTFDKKFAPRLLTNSFVAPYLQNISLYNTSATSIALDPFKRNVSGHLLNASTTNNMY